MENVTLTLIILVGLAVLVFGILAAVRFGRSSMEYKTEFDERQQLVRGKAYRAGFFTLLFYNAIYAVLDASGLHWCETTLGMIIGVFTSITVFAVVSICGDAFDGIRGARKGTIGLWIFIILAQSFCTVSEALDGDLIENGILTSDCMGAVCAICFLVILVTWWIHRNRSVRPEEEE